ncbi:TIGR03086 family metal-binding protein [Kribbella sp. NPDC058693]|uniref:TIGR03086 family metal-binding protein n=1 Tax=Kribbella sp. NPDC058693 TaxID=3346602 RepID=UPI00364BA0E7
MDVIELHNRTVTDFAELAAEVAENQWAEPTPCSDWDVRTLVNHVVGEERWTVPLMEGRTIAEVGDAFDGDLLGDDPAGTAAAAAREATAAAARTVDKVHLSYGDEDPDEYLRQLAADHLIHGWDLAVAIGAQPRLKPDLVADVASWFAEREDMYRKVGMIGPRLEGFTDPADQLLAAFGRDPHWSPAG